MDSSQRIILFGSKAINEIPLMSNGRTLFVCGRLKTELFVFGILIHAWNQFKIRPLYFQSSKAYSLHSLFLCVRVCVHNSNATRQTKANQQIK